MAWNGSKDGSGSKTQMRAKAKVRKPSPLRGIIAGVVVVGLAAGAYFLFLSGGDPKTTKGDPKPKDRAASRIAEVKPAPASTNVHIEVADEKPKRLTKKGTPIPDKVQPDARGVYRYPNGQRWVDPNDLHIVRHPKPRVLFKHTSENQIALMLQLDPTRMAPFLVGRRRPYDKRFVEDFKASLKDTPVVIDKDDTPEEAEIRRATLETKEELRARMEAGEDIAQIMNDSQKELDRLCQYHDDLRKQVREIISNPDVSNEDVEDFVTAANKLLERQGIKKFTMPNLVNRQAGILIMRERRKAQEAAKAAAGKN